MPPPTGKAVYVPVVEPSPPCGRIPSRSGAPGFLEVVTEATRILSAIERGDPGAAEQLWPIVYEELRKLAARELAREAPGQTLQATALVHEADASALVGQQTGEDTGQRWAGRRHFFLSAARAMRHILVESARRKKAAKRGGGLRRDDIDPDLLHVPAASDDLLALDEALGRLAVAEPEVAELVKLRYFAGLSIPEAAATLGVAPRTADAWWAYAALGCSISCGPVRRADRGTPRKKYLRRTARLRTGLRALFNRVGVQRPAPEAAP